MNVFNWKVTEHRATTVAVFKHYRTAVQFMYSAAGSTAGWTEGEVHNGNDSSAWPYFTNDTELKELNCWWRILSCLLIAYCAAV